MPYIKPYLREREYNTQVGTFQNIFSIFLILTIAVAVWPWEDNISFYERLLCTYQHDMLNEIFDFYGDLNFHER